jgi:uncharacterized membrane protein YdbT with pleckstrin-like domain
MNYVDNTLLPHEKLILRAHIHWIVFAPPIFMGILAWVVYFQLHQLLLSAMIAFFGILGLISATINYFCTEFAVTDKRVMVKMGFIKRDTWELNVNRVTSLNVDQSMLGRVLDYGDITVNGMGGSPAPIRAVVNPLQFRRMVLTEVEGTTLN